MSVVDEGQSPFSEALALEQEAIEKQTKQSEAIQLEQRDERVALRQQRRRPRLWTTRDLANADWLPEPQGFLKKKIFCREDVGIIAGQAQVYKTWLAMFFLGQCVLGRKIGVHETQVGRGLFLSEEMSPGQMRSRINSLWDTSEVERIDDSVSWHFQTELDFCNRTLESQKKLEGLIRDSNKPDIVIIDSMTRVHKGDENSNRDIAIVLGAFQEVATHTGVAGIYIHHAGKVSEFRKGFDRLRGASVMRDIAGDIMLIEPALEVGPGRPRSIATMPKTRHMPEPLAPFGFMVEKHPEDPNRAMLTFDESAAVSIADEEVLLREIPEVTDETGEPEVGRDVLQERMNAKHQWTGWRFAGAIAAAVKGGKVLRVWRHRKAFYAVKGQMEFRTSDEPSGEPPDDGGGA